MKIKLKYTIYIGSESTMKSIAERGCMRVLNRKTMRYQDFGKDAKYEAIKSPEHEICWRVVSDRDVRAEAKEQGFII